MSQNVRQMISTGTGLGRAPHLSHSSAGMGSAPAGENPLQSTQLPPYPDTSSPLMATEGSLGLGTGILSLRQMFGPSALRQARENIPWQCSQCRLILARNRQLWFLSVCCENRILSSVFVIRNKGYKISFFSTEDGSSLQFIFWIVSHELE